jgi:membrane protein insertase Oxa1/YidC/SpoIIIJ
MAILAGIAQFFASQMTAKHTVTMPQPGASEKNIARQKMMTKQMNYFLPVLTVIFGWTWPAGLPFYWLINTFLGMVQDYYLYKKYGANKENNRKSI